MFKNYIRLNILIVKYLFILLLSSCELIDYSVPNNEIIESSSWSYNDQPPSFPECETLNIVEQKKCFIESIEEKLIEFFNEKDINLEKAEFIVNVNIDTLGSFSLVSISNQDSISNKTIKSFNEAFESLPNALPAVKTNVGEFVNVIFDLPIKLSLK